MLPTTELLQKTIDLLPQSGALGISKFLERQEVKGARKHASNCPIAVWLTSELGIEENEHISVGRAEIAAVTIKSDATSDTIDDIVVVATPIHLLDFINKFDSGAFPTLEA